MDKKKLPYHGDQVRALGVFKNPGVEKLFRVIYDELLINIRRGNDKLVINDAKLMKDVCLTHNTFYRHKKELIYTGLVRYNSSDNSYEVALEKFYPLALLSDETRKDNDLYNKFIEGVKNDDLNSLKEMGLVSMTKQEAGEIATQLAWASKFTDKNTGAPEKSDGTKFSIGGSTKNGTDVVPNLVEHSTKIGIDQYQNDTPYPKNDTDSTKIGIGVVPNLVEHIEKILEDYKMLLDHSAIFGTKPDFAENAVKNLESLYHFWDSHSTIFGIGGVPNLVDSIIKKYNKEKNNKENHEEQSSSLKERKRNKNISPPLDIELKEPSGYFKEENEEDKEELPEPLENKEEDSEENEDDEELPVYTEEELKAIDEKLEMHRKILRDMNNENFSQSPKMRAYKKPYFSEEEVDGILNDLDSKELTPAVLLVDYFYTLAEEHCKNEEPNPLDYENAEDTPDFKVPVVGHPFRMDEYQELRTRTIRDVAEAFSIGKYTKTIWYEGEDEPEEVNYDIQMPEGYDLKLLDYVIPENPPTIAGAKGPRFLMRKADFFKNVEAEDIKPVTKQSRREAATENMAALKKLLSANEDNLSRMERLAVKVARAFCDIDEELCVHPRVSEYTGKELRKIRTSSIFDAIVHDLREAKIEFMDFIRTACWEKVDADTPLHLRDAMFSAEKIRHWNNLHGEKGILI